MIHDASGTKISAPGLLQYIRSIDILLLGTPHMCMHTEAFSPLIGLPNESLSGVVGNVVVIQSESRISETLTGGFSASEMRPHDGAFRFATFGDLNVSDVCSASDRTREFIVSTNADCV